MGENMKNGEKQDDKKTKYKNFLLRWIQATDEKRTDKNESQSVSTSRV